MDKYKVIGEIGKGCFGRVSKIIRTSDKQILIWKELNYEGIPDKEQQFIINEINILKEMNHPNIVKQYETIKDERNSKLYIVMEYCDGEDLEKLINKYKFHKKLVDEKLIWNILIQALRALNYIHNEKKILHRDIKPSNIFLDKNSNIKLGDFGLSKKFYNEYSNTIIGTPIYMSPELLERKPYNVKTDIWALGCSLYELATFSTPYEAPNMDVLLNKIRNGLPQRIDKTYSDELWSMISKMLTYDYNQRPSSLELINNCCRIFVLKYRNQRNYNQKKMEELQIFKQQLDKKCIELQKKDEKLREKEKIIRNREHSLNKLEENLKMKELELIKKEKELKEKYKNFNENKKELKEIQNEKELKEFNNQEYINKNQGNISLNNKQSYLNNNDNNKNNLLNNEVNLKNDNNNYNCEYNNNINKSNSNYNISNNQNNFNYEENDNELFFTKNNLEKFLKDNKKKNNHDLSTLDLLNN